MSILSDRWIREQAQAHGMIEPFVEAQRREGCISYGLSSYGYDARVADEFKIFTNVDFGDRRPQGFRRQQLRRPQDRRVHHPAQQLRAGAHGRIFPRAARRARHLPRQIDLCAVRDHRERDPARARLGGPCDARILEHHAAPRQGLRQRRRVPVPVPAGQRAVRGQLRRPRRQIYGAEGRDAAEAVQAVAGSDA